MAATAETITVGEGDAARTLAVLRRRGGSPGLFWLGGFRSDMQGSKAEALDQLGAEDGWAVTRFDYSGHGQSGGDFLHGTITRWLEEACTVFATTSGPQIIVGSSMGGWLALLLAKAVGVARIRALVLIAPAVDMTAALMEPGFTHEQRQQLAETGRALVPSAYSPEPYPITQALLEDGRAHLMLGRAIDIGCPIAILQGADDPDVPRAHALRLVEHLLTDPVSLTLIPEGDHRLSRPEDLDLLKRTIRRLAAD
jgi:pimeloyl-ACP methyl ester carboxylesterase